MSEDDHNFAPQQGLNKKPIRAAPDSATPTKTAEILKNKSIFRHITFTTQPKLRRLTFHKQQTVRNRAYALQESFYPTKDVLYNAVKTRMATLLGICDRMSILAYLGRPAHENEQVVEQTTRNLATGAYKKPKEHRFTRKLKGKKGYIELFGLGYVYLINNEWIVHWNHKEQLTLPPNPPTENDERVEHNITSSKSSKLNFSLSYSTPTNESELSLVRHTNGETREKEKRRESKGERNCESESIHGFHGKDHNMRVKVFGGSSLHRKDEPLEDGGAHG